MLSARACVMGQLDAKAIEDFLNDVAPLYRWYEPDADIERMRGRFLHHPDTVVDVIYDGAAVAAFGVCVVVTLANGERCLFRHGTLVAEAYRSLGLYRQLLETGLARHPTEWTATRTQNPRVFETWWKRHGDRLHPRPGVPVPDDVQRISAELAEHDPAFDPATGIFHGAYTYDRTGADYRACRETWVSDFFTALGPFDAMILVARRA